MPARRERGVVLVIAILGLALIAGLVFYVFNVGRHVQRRVEAQHAADSAAIGGASWVARSLNTVAMNNVEMTRLIATVNVLDASDEALHPAYHEADKLYHSLERQIPASADDQNAGAAIPDNPRPDDQASVDYDFANEQERRIVRSAMRPVVEDLYKDYQKLRPLHQRLEGPSEPAAYAKDDGNLDIRAYTFYNGPAGRGRLWEAFHALGAYSRATMRSLSQLAGLSAREMGQANLDETGDALLVPWAVDIPWQTGTFNDFRQPVQQGILPVDVDDPQTRRGPFDVLFGWRVQDKRRGDIPEDAEWVPNDPDNQDSPGGPRDPSGQRPGDPDGNSGGRWVPPPPILTDGYRVYGPQQFLLSDLPRARFYYSDFYEWRDRFANWKLRYLFRGLSPREYRLPVWVTDWRKIQQVAGSGRIEETKFFRLEVQSHLKADDPDFLQPPGSEEPPTWRLTDGGGDLTNHDSYSPWMFHDWTERNTPRLPFDNPDPRTWQPNLAQWKDQFGGSGNLLMQAAVKRVGETAWRLRLRTTDPYYKWRYVYFVLAGVDIGEQQTVRDPHNFADRSALPGPVMLDRAQMPNELEKRRRAHFTYLGLAQQSTQSAFWPAAFDANRPYSKAVGLAQASVFNNHSRDLWTQMWQARLEPIEQYPAWVDRLTQQANERGSVPGLDAQASGALQSYLKRTEALADLMLSH
jgi:hypothetical protein